MGQAFGTGVVCGVLYTGEATLFYFVDIGPHIEGGIADSEMRLIEAGNGSTYFCITVPYPLNTTVEFIHEGVRKKGVLDALDICNYAPTTYNAQPDDDVYCIAGIEPKNVIRVIVG